jgi:hypothetical protein
MHGQDNTSETKIFAGCNNIYKDITMKIVTLHNRINIDELLHQLQIQLNTLFKEQRQADIDFKIEKVGDTIEVSQPEIYPEDILYRIAVKGHELHITRSEHYVDDVNSLTVESILNDLFKHVAGKDGTDLIQEG